MRFEKLVEIRKRFEKLVEIRKRVDHNWRLVGGPVIEHFMVCFDRRLTANGVSYLYSLYAGVRASLAFRNNEIIVYEDPDSKYRLRINDNKNYLELGIPIRNDIQLTEFINELMLECFSTDDVRVYASHLIIHIS